VPATPNGAGVVVLPDVRGLHAFYRDLAEAFADAGVHAVAIDYFGRTATSDDRTEGSFDWQPHIAASTPKAIAQDVAAAVAHLRARPGGAASAVFTVGFCFGGSASWRQSAEGHDLSGCIGFYGGRPLERAGASIPDMRAPLLMLLAGVDSTPAEDFATFADRVRASGVAVESHTYPGAPHSFFDRSFDEHREACQDAWRRMLDFVAVNAAATG
jgi:carboxymethylenebutenolidase